MSNERATGSLYTGLTSRSSQNQRIKRQKAKAEKQEVQAQLEPVEEMVFGEITKLKNEIAQEMGNLISIDLSKTDVKSVVLGLRLATSKLSSLEMRLKNVMRGREVEEESDAEL